MNSGWGGFYKPQKIDFYISFSNNIN